MGATKDYIIETVTKKLETGKEVTRISKEQLILADAAKEPLRKAVKALDKLVFDQLDDANNAINNVGIAYQNRISSGCKSDLFWRIINFDPDPLSNRSGPTYTLMCQRLNPGGYGQVPAPGFGTDVSGITTRGLFYLEPSTGIAVTTMDIGPGKEPTGKDASGNDTFNSEIPIISLLGLEEDNYHGLKYYDEPYFEDIADTFVAGAIGTCGITTNVVTFFASPTSVEDIKLGQIVIASPAGILPQGTGTTIVGIGTTLTDTRMVDSGVTTSRTMVYKLTISNNVLGICSAPQADGSFVTFTILRPEGEIDLDDAELPSETPALTPQSVRIMKRDQIGLGVSVETDNSGRPDVTKTWNPFLLGFPDQDTFGGNGKFDIVKVPNVGAGKSYYVLGFDQKPYNVTAARDAEEGDVIERSQSLLNTGLYVNLPSCSSEINDALTDAISTRDNKETKISNDSSKINRRVTLTNQIRAEMEPYNLQIFGYRLQIGKIKEEKLSINKTTKLLEDPEFAAEVEEMDD
tara:strand:+ start:224 stop:1780 length:1557 start_codon:yes stop_codon:yes gene_type:complete